MAKQKWRKAHKDAGLKEGVPVSVEIGDEAVFFIRLGGKVHAWCGECTHYGAPLAEGRMRGDTVVCPWHNANFDMLAGRMLQGPALDDLCSYPIKVEAGQVFVSKAKRPSIAMPEGRDGRTFVIVGGGAAGNAAAEMLRRQGFAGRIVMLSQDDALPYDRTMLSKSVMAGRIEPAGAALRDVTFYGRLKIAVRLKTRVLGVNRGEREVNIAGGRPVKYDKLLLASSSIPNALEVPGAGLEGFFLLRTAADARAILEALEEAKSAVLIGASFIALECAAALRSRDLCVHVIAPEAVPMERVFGVQVGRRIKSIHSGGGVRFHMGRSLKAITGNGRVQEAVLSDGKRIAADVVIAGVGVRPAVGYLKGTGLTADGAVPVDATLRTKDENIYAAGDIAVITPPHSAEMQRVEHWIVAERTGQHAARAMLGDTAPYDEPPFFWTAQHGESIRYVGYASKYDKVVYRGDVRKGDFLAGYFRRGKLRAACTLGMGDALLVVGELLKAGGNVALKEFRNENKDLADFLK